MNPIDAQAARNFNLLAEAMDEGRISVILENASDSIDGGVIVTDMADVLDFITEQNMLKDEFRAKNEMRGEDAMREVEID